MNRFVLLAGLTLGSLLFLNGCSTTDDDDPFPIHSSATSGPDGAGAVAGEATPSRESSATGWKW